MQTHGLLRGCFHTPEKGIALRAYMRQRETLVRKASEPIQHVQKAHKLARTFYSMLKNGTERLDISS